jgi:site-specific recombinase XerD
MPNLSELVADFLVALDLERNYSPHTLASYRRNLRQFLTWMEDQERGTQLTDVTALTIRDFLGHLRDSCRNDGATVAQKLATLKSLLAYLRDSLPTPHAKGLPKVTWNYKHDKKLQRALSDTQLDQLVVAARVRVTDTEQQLQLSGRSTKRLEKQRIAAKRDLLILLLMAGTGLRVGELCAISLEDLNLEDRSIRLRGKGGKYRVVYFDIPEMVLAMQEYLQVRAEMGGDSSALLLNVRDGGRLTPRAVQLLLKGYLKDAGLDPEVTPHTLRHSFATLSIERGANVKAVSQLLGHAQVTTTLGMYTHLSEAHVRKVFQLFHPRNLDRPLLEEVVANRQRSLMYLKDATNQGQRRAIAAAVGG